MKKITLFSILAVLFAAMSFTSCNTDGDSGMNILTLEQQKSFQEDARDILEEMFS